MNKKVKVEGEELKKIQLEILDVVAKFCEENEIKYWLDYGTLLGAVRHGGYIPWDDDIDIGMLRPDYEKFMKLFNNSNDRYKFFSYENNNKFYYPYGKVLDTTTILYEPAENKKNKLNINIDVFVYDNAPEDMKVLDKMFKRRSMYVHLNSILISGKSNKKNIMLRLIKKMMHCALQLFPRGYFVKKIVKNSKKHVNEN